MWIIPKNLHTLAYVQDTEELISDLNELSELCEQSLLVKSKASPAKTWLRRWKAGSLNQHLSGRILKPSLGNSFAERWTSSVVAFHVNHSAPRENKQATKTQDISGPTSSEELRYADLPFFSLKTSQESSEQNLDKTGEQTSKAHQYCYISLENWNAEITHRRGEFSLRVKLEHHINVKEPLFLLKQMNSNNLGLITSQALSNNQNSLEMDLEESPMSGPQSEERTNIYGNHLEPSQETKSRATPIVAQVKNKVVNGQRVAKNGRPWKNLTLTDQVFLEKKEPWATPVVTMIEHDLTNMVKGRRIAANGENRSLSLLDQIHLEQEETKSWATPRTAMAAMGGSSPETDKRWENRLENQMLGRVQGTPVAEKKVLNPRWVETLMGLPIGWVSPSCTNPLLIEQMSLDSLEMELSQQPQKSLSKPCGDKSTSDWPTPTLLGHNLDKDKLVDKEGNPWLGHGRAYLNGIHKTVSLETATLYQEESQSWGTPTVMDSYQIERSVEATIHQATKGKRKGRTASSNLVEQVVFPITTQIYLLVKEYYDNGGKDGDDLIPYIKGKLQTWSTQSAGQNGTDLLCYLKRKLNHRKKGDQHINKLETEMDDLGLYFNPDNLSTEDLERMIEKVKTLTD